MNEFPSKEKKVVFGKKTYTVKFPKTGELLRIQALKAKLLRGEFGSIIESGTNDAAYTVMLAEMIAFLNVMCQDLLSDLNVDTLEQLDAVDASIFLKIYVEEIAPWYNKWMAILRNGGESVKKAKEKTPDSPEKETDINADTKESESDDSNEVIVGK